MNRRHSNKVLEIVYPSRVEGWLDAYGKSLFFLFYFFSTILLVNFIILHKSIESSLFHPPKQFIKVITFP